MSKFTDLLTDAKELVKAINEAYVSCYDGDYITYEEIKQAVEDLEETIEEIS